MASKLRGGMVNFSSLPDHTQERIIKHGRGRCRFYIGRKNGWSDLKILHLEVVDEISFWFREQRLLARGYFLVIGTARAKKKDPWEAIWQQLSR